MSIESAIALLEGKPVAEASTEASEAPAETGDKLEAQPEGESVEELDLDSGADTPQLQAIARREKYQRQKHQERIEALRRERQELESLRSQSSGSDELAKVKEELESLKRLAVANPSAFYESLGVSEKFSDIAEPLYLRELGDDAPQEAVQNYKTKKLEYEIEQLKKQLEERDQRRAKEMEQARIEREVSEFRSELKREVLKLDKDKPHVYLHSKKDPDRLAQALLEMAIEHAQSPDNYDDSVKSSDELIDELEAVLAKNYEDIYGHKLVLSEDNSAPRPVLGSSGAAQTQPKPDTLTEEDRINNAIKVIEARMASAQ